MRASLQRRCEDLRNVGPLSVRSSVNAEVDWSEYAKISVSIRNLLSQIVIRLHTVLKFLLWVQVGV